MEKKLSLHQTRPVLFQQDVFESFYDEANRAIIIRQFEGYNPQNKGPDLGKLSSLLAADNLKISIGEQVKQYGAWLTGVGGNVESISFGLSLLGSGEFSPKSLNQF